MYVCWSFVAHICIYSYIHSGMYVDPFVARMCTLYMFSFVYTHISILVLYVDPFVTHTSYSLCCPIQFFVYTHILICFYMYCALPILYSGIKQSTPHQTSVSGGLQSTVSVSPSRMLLFFGLCKGESFIHSYIIHHIWLLYGVIRENTMAFLYV